VRLGDVSGVAAVANGEVERAGAGNGDDGCSALRWLLAGEEGGRGEAKMERGRGRADAGGVKAAPRRVVACADRALATRGRFSSTRRPRTDGGRPLYIRDSVHQTRSLMPDSEFTRRISG